MTPEFEKLTKVEARLYRRIARLYARNLTAVQKEIAAYYAEYGDGNIVEYRLLLEKLSPAERDLLYRDWDAFVAQNPEYAHLTPSRATAREINRLEGLEQRIKLNQYRQGIIEIGEYTAHLEKAATLGWNAAMKGLPGVMISNATAAVIANATADHSIAVTMLGKKATHASKIFHHVKNGFIRGDSYARMAKDIEQRFGINYRNAKQWVYTEGSRCLNEGKAQGFTGMGYKRYIYRTMQDGNVCEICAAMDGEEYEFTEREPGLNFPPMHANCRCSFEVVNDET